MHFLFLLLLVSQISFAQGEMSAKGLSWMQSDESDLEAGEVEDELDDDDQQIPLSRGIAFGLGYVAPWQSAGASYIKNMSSLDYFTVASGFSRLELSTFYTGTTFDNEMTSQSVLLGWRRMISATLPAFAEFQGGLVKWKGTVTAKITGTPPVNTYDAYGIVASLGLGFHWVLTPQIYIEYLFLNLSKSKSFDKKINGQPFSGTEGALTEDLEQHRTWGIINIKVGWII